MNATSKWKSTEKKKIPHDQTNKDGGEGGAVDMETESYEYETIFQIS